jgi:putative oxidoreductase
MNRALDALRVLLGVVMVASALRYFLPALLPFVPIPHWDDPMSIRLMDQFGHSGLLGVAKAIHLVAGVLLIVNRGVPFALAALVPVNLNGTYITLFVEGDPLWSLVAVLIMAANALLMFAYLPWYRGVLEPGQLADGEGPEDGNNYVSLYVNPLSTAPASAYTMAALVLLAASAFYWFVVLGLNSTTGLVVLAIPAVILAVGWARALTRKA